MVGVAVGKQAPNEWHDLAEVDVVAEAQNSALGAAHIEQRNATTGTNNSRQFGEERVELHEVAKRKAARDAVDRAVV